MSSKLLLERGYSGQLGSSSTTLYTCPANTRARVIKANACNDTTTVPSMTFYLVPSGGSPGVTNLLINARNLPGNGTDSLREIVGQVLEPGDSIRGLASSADQVTVHLAVVEVVDVG